LKLVHGDRVLGVRADFTGPVARVAATRLMHVEGPVRLCYRGIVYRGGRQRWQAGAELFGVRGTTGDVEVLRVAFAALAEVGVRGVVAVAGSVAALRSVAPGAVDDPAVRDALDRRDVSALGDHPNLASLVRSGGSVPELEALREALGPLAERVRIDPAHVRRFPYYTGVVFDLFAPGFSGPIGGGGRYDGLSARYGRARPAVGFSFDVDVLARGAVS